MNDTKRKAAPSPAFFTDFKRFQARNVAITNGAQLTSATDTRLTCAAIKNDWRADAQAWASDLLRTLTLTDEQNLLLGLISGGDFRLQTLQQLRLSFDGNFEVLERLDIYLAVAGDAQALVAEIFNALVPDPTAYTGISESIHHWIWVLGLADTLRTSPSDKLPLPSAIRSAGIAALAHIARGYAELDKAISYHLGDDVAADPKDELFAALRGAALEAVEADVAEIDPNFRPADDQLRLETLVVMPAIDTSKISSAKKDQTRSLIAFAGKPQPIAAVPHLGDFSAEMRGDFPHLDDAIERIAILLGTMRSVRGLKLLFVGPPGAGKTEFGRSLFENLQVPHVIYGCGGSSDGSFGGTSSMYSTARAPTPLTVAAIHGVAAPGIILDEIDKISDGRHNGNLGDALLSFLEPSSSRSILDPLTETQVDLSAVNYIATANSLENVPAPLRDRFKVIQIPAPTWRHIGPISSSIISRIAEERGLDRRWVQLLAEDELELLKSAWQGGSLRRLRQAIEVLLTGRDANQRRH
jgi:hypothetical protein